MIFAMRKNKTGEKDDEKYFSVDIYNSFRPKYY